MFLCKISEYMLTQSNVQWTLSELLEVTGVWQFISMQIPIKFIFKGEIPLSGHTNL